MPMRPSHVVRRVLLVIFAALAVGGCSQLAGLRPPAGASQAERGIRELRSGNAAQAEAQFQTAVKLAGSDYRTAVVIAAECAAMRQWELAARYGEPALKQVPKSDKVTRIGMYAALTTAYVGLGDHDKAIQLAKQGYAEDPEEPANMNLLGYVYAELAEVDKLPEAYDLTEKAVKTAVSEGRPEDEIATYLDSLGWVKYQQGKVEDAIADLSQAAYILPQQPDVLYHLGMAYMKKSRYADALVVLQRAFRMAPSHREAEAALKQAVEKLPPTSPDQTVPPQSTDSAIPTDSPVKSPLPSPNP